MEDPVKRTAVLTEFSPENTVKVPALLHLCKGAAFLQFHLAFANFEIVAAHLLKSDEWIYGIYDGPHYFGYLYYGEKLTLEQQFACVRDFLPTDRNQLPQMATSWKGRINYYRSQPDQFAIIGEYEGRKVIRKPKQFNDNPQIEQL